MYLTEDEFKTVLEYLERLLFELEENTYGRYADQITLKEFITKLQEKEKEKNDKPSEVIELIIARLLEQKQKIYVELTRKYKNIALKEDWDVDKLVNIFNKKEPELMGQLFFIDMELVNLGYEDS